MDYKKLVIGKEASQIQALRQMDENRKKMLLVFDEGKFFSIITVGAIQRAIIKCVDLNEPLSTIISTSDMLFGYKSDSKEVIKDKMLKIRAQLMPVLDDDGNLCDVFLWEDFFPSEDIQAQRSPINLPVVIMAGGKGTRLKPITNILPKPLIPIGEKTILEEIMDRFEGIGCNKFYMSINYKREMMRFYLEQLDHKYNIEFFEEPIPLGTIGSVSLLKDKIKSPFFVSNCDIVIDQDCRDVYDYHLSNKNDITIVTAVKSIKIPYGVIETEEDGLMKGLKEKPEITYMINSGVYLLNDNLIDEIPEGEFFHITHLIDKVKKKGGRVGCFPVSEHAWKDMGEWPEYLKMIKVR